jgi:N-carbamoyl-L-amino-acid hydrolase
MIKISGERLLADLRRLAQFGRYETGVDRVALSAVDIEARRWVMGRMEEAGLKPRMDGVANVIGRWPEANRAILIGSHTDTVPKGGWLDGALGVMYALEIARAAREQLSPIGIDVVSFQDEEGSYLPFLGSRLFCDDLPPAEIDAARRGEVSLRSALAGVDGEASPNRFESGRHVCYLEAHIEQGPRLEAAGCRIGIVSGVVGIRRFRIKTRGQANHAGTTPMAMRRDAGAPLFALASRVTREFPRLGGPDSVWNIGSTILRPGAANVVPGEGEMMLEFRDIDTGILDRLEAYLREWIAQLSRDGCSIEADSIVHIAPTPMSKELADTLAASAKAMGEEPLRIPSGAGHDAMIVGRLIPAAMLFVPSIGGVSHDVTENTADADIVLGCEVLAAAVDKLRSGDLARLSKGS